MGRPPDTRPDAIAAAPRVQPAEQARKRRSPAPSPSLDTTPDARAPRGAIWLHEMVAEPSPRSVPIQAVAGAGATHYKGGTQELTTMEGLRLAAAAIVVWFHCQTVTSAIKGGGPAGMWIIRTGYFAVDALFLLSGFAQFLPFAAAGPDKEQDWRGYAIRRFMRIVPAYYVALALTTLYIGQVSLGAGHSGKVVGVWELLIHALFLHHVFYGVGGQVGLGINTAMWTLTAEAAFYVVLPFVARRFLRHPMRGLVIALAVSIAWRLFAIEIGPKTGPSVYLVSQAPAFAFQFALGMAAAMLVVRLRAAMHAGGPGARRITWLGLAALIYGVAAVAASLRAADPAAHGFSQRYALYNRFVWNLVPATAFAILLVAIAIAPWWSHWLISNRVVRWLGEGSYGMYLLHILVMLEMARLWHSLGHQQMSLLAFASLCCFESALLGRLSFLLVEEPCRRFARNTAARWARARRSGQPRRLAHARKVVQRVDQLA